MGQPITIDETVRVGDVVVFGTDRSLTGQHGETFDSPETAAGGSSFAAGLARELFAADEALDHVYVYMNEIVVRRAGGWDDAAVSRLGKVIERFFVFYRDGADGSVAQASSPGS